MGFIGGGAILRRGKLVTGVTTAATLWFVTVMGLCFGGGQLGLGFAALGSGVVVLTILQWLESRMRQDRTGTLIISLHDNGPDERQIREDLLAAHFKIVSFAVTFAAFAKLRKVRCELQWRADAADMRTPDVVKQLSNAPGIARLHWRY